MTDPATPSAKEIGDIVRAARKAVPWSQTELAVEAGVSRPTVARIEGGKDGHTAALDKVVEALGLSLVVHKRKAKKAG